MTLTLLQRQYIRLPLGVGAVLLYLPYAGINGSINPKELQDVFAGKSFTHLLIPVQMTVMGFTLVAFPYSSATDLSKSVF